MEALMQRVTCSQDFTVRPNDLFLKFAARVIFPSMRSLMLAFMVQAQMCAYPPRVRRAGTKASRSCAFVAIFYYISYCFSPM
jgi:hypothetical protein